LPPRRVSFSDAAARSVTQEGDATKRSPFPPLLKGKTQCGITRSPSKGDATEGAPPSPLRKSKTLCGMRRAEIEGDAAKAKPAPLTKQKTQSRLRAPRLRQGDTKRVEQPVQPAETKTLMNQNMFAAVALGALNKHEKDSIRWRGKRERKCRNALAWFVNAAFYFFAGLVVLAFGVKALGPKVMNATVISWVIAMMQVFFILEPLQACLIACLPFIASEDTRCGRCCRRAQWCYNEFFSP